MKYKKVICIETNNDDRLIFHKEYWCVIYRYVGDYFIYCKNNLQLEPVGFFPCYLFKTVKQVRKKRLNKIL